MENKERMADDVRKSVNALKDVVRKSLPEYCMQSIDDKDRFNRSMIGVFISELMLSIAEGDRELAIEVLQDFGSQCKLLLMQGEIDIKEYEE